MKKIKDIRVLNRSIVEKIIKKHFISDDTDLVNALFTSKAITMDSDVFNPQNYCNGKQKPFTAYIWWNVSSEAYENLKYEYAGIHKYGKWWIGKEISGIIEWDDYLMATLLGISLASYHNLNSWGETIIRGENCHMVYEDGSDDVANRCDSDIDELYGCI